MNDLLYRNASVGDLADIPCIYNEAILNTTAVYPGRAADPFTAAKLAAKNPDVN